MKGDLTEEKKPKLGKRRTPSKEERYAVKKSYPPAIMRKMKLALKLHMRDAEIKNYDFYHIDIVDTVHRAGIKGYNEAGIKEDFNVNDPKNWLKHGHEPEKLETLIIYEEYLKIVRSDYLRVEEEDERLFNAGKVLASFSGPHVDWNNKKINYISSLLSKGVYLKAINEDIDIKDIDIWPGYKPFRILLFKPILDSQFLIAYRIILNCSFEDLLGKDESIRAIEDCKKSASPLIAMNQLVKKSFSHISEMDLIDDKYPMNISLGIIVPVYPPSFNLENFKRNYTAEYPQYFKRHKSERHKRFYGEDYFRERMASVDGYPQGYQGILQTSDFLPVHLTFSSVLRKKDSPSAKEDFIPKIATSFSFHNIAETHLSISYPPWGPYFLVEDIKLDKFLSKFGNPVL